MGIQKRTRAFSDLQPQRNQTKLSSSRSSSGYSSDGERRKSKRELQKRNPEQRRRSSCYQRRLYTSNPQRSDSTIGVLENAVQRKQSRQATLNFNTPQFKTERDQISAEKIHFKKESNTQHGNQGGGTPKTTRMPLQGSEKRKKSSFQHRILEPETKLKDPKKTERIGRTPTLPRNDFLGRQLSSESSMSVSESSQNHQIPKKRESQKKGYELKTPEFWKPQKIIFSKDSVAPSSQTGLDKSKSGSFITSAVSEISSLDGQTRQLQNSKQESIQKRLVKEACKHTRQTLRNIAIAGYLFIFLFNAYQCDSHNSAIGLLAAWLLFKFESLPWGSVFKNAQDDVREAIERVCEFMLLLFSVKYGGTPDNSQWMFNFNVVMVCIFIFIVLVTEQMLCMQERTMNSVGPPNKMAQVYPWAIGFRFGHMLVDKSPQSLYQIITCGLVQMCGLLLVLVLYWVFSYFLILQSLPIQQQKVKRVVNKLVDGFNYKTDPSIKRLKECSAPKKKQDSVLSLSNLGSQEEMKTNPLLESPIVQAISPNQRRSLISQKNEDVIENLSDATSSKKRISDSSRGKSKNWLGQSSSPLGSMYSEDKRKRESSLHLEIEEIKENSKESENEEVPYASDFQFSRLPHLNLNQLSMVKTPEGEKPEKIFPSPIHQSEIDHASVSHSDESCASKKQRFSYPSASPSSQVSPKRDAIRQSSSFWNYYNSAQRLALQDAMLSNLNQCVMICKIKPDLDTTGKKRRSSQMADQLSDGSISKSQTHNLGKKENHKEIRKNKRKIKLDIIQAVSEFFTMLPHYEQFSYIFKNASFQVSPKQSRNLVSLKSQIDMNHSIILKNQLKTLSNDMVSRKSFQRFGSITMKRCETSNNQLDSVMSWGEDDISEFSRNKSLHQSLSKPLINKEPAKSNYQSGFKSFLPGVANIGELERELLELKIYQPYYMSKRTVIQFLNMATSNSYMVIQQSERLSIMDILEQYYIQKSTNSRLYFKVNLNEDITHSFRKFGSRKTKSETLLKFENQLSPLPLADRISVRGQQDTELEISIRSAEQRIRQSIIGSNLLKNQIEEIEENQSEENKENQQVLGKRSSEWTLAKENSELYNDPNGIEKVVEIGESSSSENNNEEEQNNALRVKETFSLNSIELSDSLSSNSAKQNDIQINKSISTSNQSKTSMAYDTTTQQLSGAFCDDQIRYYEFEMKQVDQIQGMTRESNLTFVNIKDITQLVKNQQKCSDLIYQEAIENNYSHEQMTPLNCIQSFSSMVRQVLQDIEDKEGTFQQIIRRLNKELLSMNIHLPPPLIYQLQQVFEGVQKAIEMLTPVEQSAQSMMYYNSNQITRMQIKKNQLKIVSFGSHNIIRSVKSVAWPFEMQIKKQRINVYVLHKIPKEANLLLDWKLYELVFYNIFQNAIKYNNHEGDVIIILCCKKAKRMLKASIHDGSSALSKAQAAEDGDDIGEQYMLETEIIDSGIGIDERRQKMLFIPFLELKNQQGIMRAKNDTIGLGLSGSSEITRKMGGDIRLKQSEKGLTVFTFKVPVKIQQTASPKFSLKKSKRVENNQIVRRVPSETEADFQLYGQPRLLKPEVLNYLQGNGMIKPNDFLSNMQSAMDLNKYSDLRRHNTQFRDKPKSTYNSPMGLTFNMGMQRKISEKTNSQKDLLKSDSPLGLIISKKDQVRNSGLASQISFNQFSAIQQDLSRKRPSKIQLSQDSVSSHSIRQVPEQVSNRQKSLSEEKLSGQKFFLKQVIPNLSMTEFEPSQDSQSESISCASDQKKSSWQRLSGMNEIQENEIEEDMEETPPNSGIVFCPKKRIYTNLSPGIHSRIRKQMAGPKTLSERAQLMKKKGSFRNRKSCKDFKRLTFPSNNFGEWTPQNNRDRAGYRKRILRFFPKQDFPCNKLVQHVMERKSAKSSSFTQNHKFLPILQTCVSPNVEKLRKIIRSGSSSKEIINSISGKEKKSMILEALTNNHRHPLNQMHIQQDLAEKKPAKFQSPDSYYQREQVFSVILNKVSPKKRMQELDACSLSSEQYSSDLSFNKLMPDDSIKPGSPSPCSSAKKKRFWFCKKPVNHLISSISESDEDWEALPSSKKKSQKKIKMKKLHTLNLANLPHMQSLIRQREGERSGLTEKLRKDRLSLGGSNQCKCEGKILIVDDTMFNIYTLSNLIQTHFGITPDEAENGEVAVKRCKQLMQKPCQCSKGYRLILMDIQMPKMDGYEATIAIKEFQKKQLEKQKKSGEESSQINSAIPCEKDIRIVAVTAYSSVKVKEKCLELGMEDVVSKPINILHLREIMYLHYFRYSQEETQQRLAADRDKLVKADNKF